MNTSYFIVAMIVFTAVIAVQLIKMSVTVTKLTKNDSLLKEEIKEDTSWEFIKGLY
ncbi:MAG TPA: hypothetical protein VMT76_07515 [Puia sp.]|nr:hypothetical protein [Puia sp.]